MNKLMDYLVGQAIFLQEALSNHELLDACSNVQVIPRPCKVKQCFTNMHCKFFNQKSVIISYQQHANTNIDSERTDIYHI